MEGIGWLVGSERWQHHHRENSSNSAPPHRPHRISAGAGSMLAQVGAVLMREDEDWGGGASGAQKAVDRGVVEIISVHHFQTPRLAGDVVRGLPFPLGESQWPQVEQEHVGPNGQEENIGSPTLSLAWTYFGSPFRSTGNARAIKVIGDQTWYETDMKVWSFREMSVAKQRLVDARHIPGERIVLDFPPKQGRLSGSGPDLPDFKHIGGHVVAIRPEADVSESIRASPGKDPALGPGFQGVSPPRAPRIPLVDTPVKSVPQRAGRPGVVLAKALRPHCAALRRELWGCLDGIGDAKGASFAAKWQRTEDTSREGILSDAWQSLMLHVLRALPNMEMMRDLLVTVEELRGAGAPRLPALMQRAMARNTISELISCPTTAVVCVGDPEKTDEDSSGGKMSPKAPPQDRGSLGGSTSSIAKVYAMGLDGVDLVREAGVLHLLLEVGSRQIDEGLGGDAMTPGSGTATSDADDPERGSCQAPKAPETRKGRAFGSASPRMMLGKKTAMLMSMARSMEAMCQWELGML